VNFKHLFNIAVNHKNRTKIQTMKIKSILSLLILGALTTSASGQENTGSGKYGLPTAKAYDTWSVGISFGNTFFFGDVKDTTNEDKAISGFDFVPGFGIQVNKQLTHSVGLRLSGMYGTLKSGPSFEKIDDVQTGGTLRLNNAEVESPVIDLALEGVYTFGNISHLKRDKRFHLFMSLGAGITNYNSDLTGQVDNIGSNAGKDTILSSGSQTTINIPFGIGFKYQVGKVDVALSLDYRKLFTDNVDLVDKPITENDAYMFMKLGANYTFGKNNKAMEWINPMEVVYNDLADVKDRVDLLSGDKDKDGVSDIFDKDNSTEEGIKVYGDGTAIDTDGDGIADHKDGDPFSLRGAKVNENGIEIDTDGDGVPDGKDLEPNTPTGSLVNFQGTSIENALYGGGASGTGVDGSSGASGAAGAAGASGSSYLPSVFFDVNSTAIKQVYKDRVLIVARAMKAKPSLKVVITGNADRSGDESSNQRLGLRRAEAVKNHLVKVYGIEESRITVESKGSQTPMADPSNSAMDRRVDFSFGR
jgi:OOP family OmpA-OmpF porin